MKVTREQLAKALAEVQVTDRVRVRGLRHIPASRAMRVPVTSTYTYPSDADYLTTEEFAALPSVAHHVIWKAYVEHTIDSVPVSAASGSTRRYHREQAGALLFGDRKACRG